MSRATFVPCAVVPVYNHGKTAGAVTKALIEKGLPVILVDDASDRETKKALQAISKKYKKAKLFTLKKNLGKGGAVSHGLIKAFENGFTHALQVDADGQHDLKQIERFIKASKKSPNLLIAGAPVYNESIPAGRKFGRKLTNFFVAIETLSLDIKDAMCGFRFYPLAATHALLTRVKLSERMDFDIEILVRLHWQGVKIHFLPVKVIYPEDGISHFRMIRDNIAISRIHTLLVLGMLGRLPLRLFYKVFKKRTNA